MMLAGQIVLQPAAAPVCLGQHTLQFIQAFFNGQPKVIGQKEFFVFPLGRINDIDAKGKQVHQFTKQPGNKEDVGRQPVNPAGLDLQTAENRADPLPVFLSLTVYQSHDLILLLSGAAFPVPAHQIPQKAPPVLRTVVKINMYVALYMFDERRKFVQKVIGREFAGNQLSKIFFLFPVVFTVIGKVLRGQEIAVYNLAEFIIPMQSIVSIRVCLANDALCKEQQNKHGRKILFDPPQLPVLPAPQLMVQLRLDLLPGL